MIDKHEELLEKHAQREIAMKEAKEDFIKEYGRSYL